MTVMNLDQLDAWKRARDFAVLIYKQAIPHLPASEKYNLEEPEIYITDEFEDNAH